VRRQEAALGDVIVASATPDLPEDARQLASVLVVPKAGASAAKNVALAGVRSDAVAFIDDDCVADPRWLRAFADRFRARGPRLAGITGRVLPTREGLYLVQSESHPGPRTFASLSESVPVWRIGGGLNMAFHRSVLERIGAFDPRFGPGSPLRSAEELDLFYRVLASGYEIDYDPAALVYHEPLDTFPQVARTRYAYRFGLGAWFARHRRDPIQRRTFRTFLASELHDAKAVLLRPQPGSAVLSAFGLLGLLQGRFLSMSFAPQAAGEGAS
jgi:cellulose synthase/poly-beta-1,6-N-acetylglucosamine synthase-like glycosyltransferase